MAFVSSEVSAAISKEGLLRIAAPRRASSNDTEKLERLDVGAETRESVLDVEDPVLQFDAYYCERVPESSEERERTRRVKIIHWVNDQTTRIREPVQENSGLNQGTILRRQRIPRSAVVGGEGEFLGIEDLPVPGKTTIYSRVYYIISCDPFTKEYLNAVGLECGEFQSFPADPVLERLQSGTKGRVTVPTTKPIKANTGAVLRFYCWWEDETEEFPEPRHYILHWYCDDDTAEVREDREANDGRIAFPLFLLRQKLPKKYTFATADLSAVDKSDHYHASELVVGGTVMVVGRVFHIYDCDAFTRQYFHNTYDVEQGKESARRETFDFDAFMATLKSQPREPLVPRAPKSTTVRPDAEGKVMRFGARLISDSPIDKDRRFIISFFLADDTISVYEPPQRNTGISGGSFLRRSRLKRPDGDTTYPPTYYGETDLQIGTVLEVHKRKFALVDADEFALHYMESHPDLFPSSNVAVIQEKVKGVIKAESADSDGDGCVSTDEFRAYLHNNGVDLNEQEIVTLLRRFDIDGDGKVAINEFLK